MKKLIIYCTLFLSSLGFVACSDFLTEDPKTKLSESVVYINEANLEAQVYGIYNAFNGWCNRTTAQLEYLDCASALLIWKGSQAKNVNAYDQVTLGKYSYTTDGNIECWNALYAGVNRCNRLLDNLPASPVDENYKTEIEAEAKLLRAIFYYDIVRLWADVPLFTFAPKKLDEINAPRTAFYKVYKQILDDLDFAEKNMRDKARQEQINPENDRLYNYAATAFKASVYLTIGSLLSAPADDNFWDSNKDSELVAKGLDPRTPDFTPCGISNASDAFKLAMECADKVIDEGPYSLESDYRRLFRWDAHEDFYLPESIFRLHISKTSTVTSNVVWYTLPLYPEGTIDVSVKNSNYGRVRPSRWGVDNFIKRTGGVHGTGTNNANLYTTTTDPRYCVSMRDTYVDMNTNKTITCYPVNDKYVNYTDNNDYYNVPFIWKYCNPRHNGKEGECAFYYMRLAEMYLISAEAAAQLSTSKGDANWNKAVERVNVLRKRAACSNDNGTLDENVWNALQWDDTTFPTLDELRMGVWWERYIELSFEGHEFFDTHRYGATWLSEKIAKPCNEFMNQPVHEIFVGRYFPGRDPQHVYPETPQELRKSLLLAFPRDEILSNPAINEQNDFYWE